MNLWKITPASRSLLRSCFCRSGLGVSGGDLLNPKSITLYRLSDTEGGGLGGAKGGATVECAALCETAAAMLLEALRWRSTVPPTQLMAIRKGHRNATHLIWISGK